MTVINTELQERYDLLCPDIEWTAGIYGTCLCPFCSGKFNINLNEDRWLCYSCKEKGDIVRLEEKITKIPQAVVDSDMANAMRFAKSYGHRVKFTPERGWLVWDSKRWCADNELVMPLAKETSRSVYDEIKIAPDEKRKELFKWAKRSQESSRITGMLRLAQSEPGIPERFVRFDADPLLFNVQNGIINLKTGELEPHKSANRCCRISPVSYDPKASCELWLSFLDRVMAGKQDVINHLKKAIGYSLTGLTDEQVLFFLYGNGANGKSVLLEIVNMVLGEYSTTASMETFTLKQGSNIPNDIARLAGARYVAVNETADGQRLHEPLIKDLTGGDTVTARFLHREYFDFKPQFKLWIRGNHKPVIKGTDDGIWRRIHLIPFNVQIPEAERDLKLTEKLKQVLPGILTWAVQGCIEWQKEGLKAPDSIRLAVKEYRAESDILGSFLSECCLLGESFQVSSKDLYATYRNWAEKSGERPVSQTRFGNAMRERGFEKERNRSARFYNGIGISVTGLDSVTGCDEYCQITQKQNFLIEKNLTLPVTTRHTPETRHSEDNSSPILESDENSEITETTCHNPSQDKCLICERTWCQIINKELCGGPFKEDK